MPQRGVGLYVLMPVLGVAALVWTVQLFDVDRHSAFFSENGFVELGTAGGFSLAAALALRLVYVGRNSIPQKYRCLFVLFAVTACFVSLEEISYGQHLFGWRGPDFFLRHSTKREINLHNLYGDSLSNVLRQVANVAFPAGLILLPMAALRRHRQLDSSDWVYYLLPKTELIATVLIAQLVSPLDKLAKWLVGVDLLARPGEVQKLFWSLAAAMHMWVINRRLLDGVEQPDVFTFRPVDTDQPELRRKAA